MKVMSAAFERVVSVDRAFEPNLNRMVKSGATYGSIE